MTTLLLGKSVVLVKTQEAREFSDLHHNFVHILNSRGCGIVNSL